MAEVHITVQTAKKARSETMSKIIGLTGGIATGKSTVTKMFLDQSIPVIDADAIAKDLLDINQPAYKEIVDLLGNSIVLTDQSICRQKLAKIIFSDPAIREQVNAIIHPKVIDIMNHEIDHLKRLNHPLIVLDVPLLFESNLDKMCDVTVFVYAKQSDQISRLIKRDQIDEAYAKQKIKAQWPLSEKRRRADYTIDNSKSILETRKAFDKLLRALKEES